MQKDKKRSKAKDYLIKPPVAGFLAFLFFVLVGCFVLWQRLRIMEEEQQREMSNIANLVEENIELSLKNTYSAALTLALLIDNEGKISNFESVAPQLVERNSIIDAVELNPGGVITYVYPLEGNREALNYDILADSARNTEAYKAISEKKMFFAGPLRLKQGGVAVIGRLPVFKNGDFWGFSAVVIKLNDLLRQSGVYQLAGEKYDFQLSKCNPQTGKEIFFLPGSTNFKRAYAQDVVLPEGDWRFYIAPVDPQNIIYRLIPLALFFFFISIWFGWAMMKLLKRPARLERLVEAQAGELYKSELKFRTIYDRATLGMALTDSRTGKILETNPRFRSIFGYKENELRGVPYQEFTHPDDVRKDEENMQKLIKGEIREYSLQKRVFRKNGEPAWVNLTVSPLWEKGHEASRHIAFMEDITEMKQAELDLNKSYKMVLEQNQRLLNFSYIVSHDLRSHSSNVQAILDLYETSPSAEERGNYIDLLKKVSTSLDQTLRDLNDVVSIQTNVNINVESMQVKKSLGYTLDLLDVEVRRKGAQLHTDIPEEMIVTFNPAYMQSILLNFLSNALRYSHPDRKPEICIKGYWVGQWVLEVSDNGIGIDLQRHGKKLFGLYKTFAKRGDSRGVGLFITKNQVEAMGGRVEVESEPGKGSKFRVYFKAEERNE
ncbi:MAG: PAS domain S-box protein [Salegentibacter sp.]